MRYFRPESSRPGTRQWQRVPGLVSSRLWHALVSLPLLLVSVLRLAVAPVPLGTVLMAHVASRLAPHPGAPGSRGGLMFVGFPCGFCAPGSALGAIVAGWSPTALACRSTAGARTSTALSPWSSCVVVLFRGPLLVFTGKLAMRSGAALSHTARGRLAREGIRAQVAQPCRGIDASVLAVQTSRHHRPLPVVANVYAMGTIHRLFRNLLFLMIER